MPEVLIPLVQDPDWGNPIEEAQLYWTDILPSYNAHEQRVQLRLNPRVRLRYRLLLADAEQAARFERDIWGLGALRVYVPFWQDAALLESPAAPSDDFLVLDALTRRFVAEGLALIWRDPQNYEIVEIAAVNPPAGHLLTYGLSLGSLVAGTWPADGRTWVFPLLVGRLDDAPEIVRPNVQVASVDIEAVGGSGVAYAGFRPPDPLRLFSGSAQIQMFSTTALDDDTGARWKDFLLQKMPADAGIQKIYAVARASFVPGAEPDQSISRIAFGDSGLVISVLATNRRALKTSEGSGAYDGYFYEDVDGPGVAYESGLPFAGSGLTLQQWLDGARIMAAGGHSLFLSGLDDLTTVTGLGFAIYYDLDFAPHDLTSDTSHSPYVVSSSTEDSSFPSFRAFDRAAANSCWISMNGGVDWLKLDLGAGNTRILGSYSIQVNTIPQPLRAPRKWTLEGSNDDSNWDILDSRTNQTDWDSGERRIYVCPQSSTAYRYFRVNISENNGDPDHTQIGELCLHRVAEEGEIFDGSDDLPAPVPIPEGQGVAWSFPSTVELQAPDPLKGIVTASAAEWLQIRDWPYIYRGYDLLPWEPNRVEDLKTVWRRSLHHLDPGTGMNQAWDRIGVPILSRASLPFLFEDRERIDEFLFFLRRRSGALIPFWMPSWARDFEMTADLAMGGTELIVRDNNYSSGPFQNDCRRYLAIILRGDEQYYREIVDAAPGDPGEEILTLDEGLPVALDKDHTLLCYLVLARLMEDESVVNWRTTEIIETILQTVELPQEAPQASETAGGTPPPDGDGTIYFEDDFEGGDTSNWTYFSSGQGTDVLVNGTAAYAGSYGLNIHYTRTAPGDINRWIAKAVTAEPTTISVQERIYIKHPESGALLDNIQRKFFALYNGTGGSPGSEFGIFLTSDSVLTGQVPLRVSINGSVASDIQAGDVWSDWDIYRLDYDTWYLLEFVVKLNTPHASGGPYDGEYWLYVDGSMVRHGTGKVFRGTSTKGVGHVRIGLQSDTGGTGTIDEYRYIDNVVISDSYIGIGS
jgi:hypothetical protein